MQSSFKIGRIYGIDIGVHWSWLLIFVLLTWSFAVTFFDDESATFRWIAGGVISLVFFGSVLIHELSHSIVAKRRGIGVSSITLFVFGGVSNLERESESARDEFWIAVVGPASSVAIGVVFAAGWLALRGTAEEYANVLGYLGVINIAIAIFNMLPGFPLDGGRVLRSILWGVKDNLVEATRTAARVGTLVAYGIMGLGVLSFFAGNIIGGIWFILIGWFLQNASESSLQQTLLDRALRGVTVGSIMQPDFDPVPEGITVRDLVEDHVLPHSRRAFPVVDGGRVIGLVTLSDVKEVPRERWDRTPVREIMTPADRLKVLRPGDDVRTALEIIQQHDINQIPVMEDGRVQGLVTRGDLIRAIQIRSEIGTVGGQGA